MIHLDTILGTLLLHNNCVIIPSLGGFIASSVSAKIDVKNGLITPPTKALSFNKNLSNNDGLIVHYLTHQNKISFDEAQDIIALEVQQIKASLNQGKRVHFHNVGFLYLNNAGKIAFEQDRFFNLLLSSYGLGTVHFVTEQENEGVETPETPKEILSSIVEKPTLVKRKIEVSATEKVEPKKETKEIQHPAVATKTSKKLITKIVKYAAVAALVPVLFYSYWIPMKTDVLQSGVVYTDDFNPFNKVEPFRYFPEINRTPLLVDSVHPSNLLSSITENLSSSSPVFAYPLDDDLFITVRRKPEVRINHSTIVNDEVTLFNQNKFHAVVGCFSNPINAEELIKELKNKGFDAYKVDIKGGLHRVSAGSANNRTELSLLRERLQEKEFSSWVLRK